jgi:uncharacterized protein YpmS
LVLSTLTKILVVLLSVFSFGLCGAVLIYVGNENNYKALWEEQIDSNQALLSNNKSLNRQITEKIEEWKKDELSYKQEIQRLNDEMLKLDSDLRKAERTSTEYQNRVNSWVGLLDSFQQTIGNLEQSLKLTQQQLDKARETGIKDQQELNEITASLIEKIAQMQALERDRRRFLEEKKSLEDKLNQLFGTDVVTEVPTTVTPEPGVAKAAQPIPAGAPLNGLITEVGESLVTISIGADDGVRKGMVFHVTRGGEFICDVVITDVDTNKAAGSLELKMQQPRIGDNVSTKL